MIVTHDGISYECAVAVKCENDKYIKLYDASGALMVSFDRISNFDEFAISGGSFVVPCDCALPIPLSAFSLGGRTITPDEWINSNGKFHYEITNDIISGNAATCDILLVFAKGTSFVYDALQEDGKIVLSVRSVPNVDIVIESIKVTKA